MCTQPELFRIQPYIRFQGSCYSHADCVPFTASGSASQSSGLSIKWQKQHHKMLDNPYSRSRFERFELCES